MATAWYVVQAQPAREEVAIVNLSKQGFETYLPRYKKVIRHARKSITMHKPLFPRYLFIRMDIETKPWRSINGTIGVVGLLCAGDKPASVADQVVDSIRNNEDVDGLIVMGGPQYYSGEPLRIIGGPFIEQIGFYQETKDQDRVVLLLKLLGRNVKINTPAMLLEKAG